MISVIPLVNKILLKVAEYYFSSGEYESAFPFLLKNYPIDKEKVKTLLGAPDFIDKHKAGEDWYYSHIRSTGYAVVSFPTSGHLVNHVQYVKRPEWK